MDLFTIVGTCLRRWYLTVPLLLLVVFFSYRAYASVEPLYTSSRSIVVLPSLEAQAAADAEDEDAEPDGEDNPYSGQGGSRFAVAVLKRNINSSAFEERLDLDPGVEESFEADSSSDQPMIHIDATAPSQQGVHDLLDDVVDESGVVLDEFQADAGAPEVSRYRLAPAVPAGPVEDATPSRLRAAGAIAVLGGGLVAIFVVGADMLLAGRRRRRDEATARAGAEGGTESGHGRHREAASDDTDAAEPTGAAGTSPPRDGGGRELASDADGSTRSGSPTDEDRVSTAPRD